MRAAVIFFCIYGLAAPVSAADWTLEIIPNGRSADAQSIDTRGEAFVVLLTNETNHDLNTWIEEFSWGYDNLSFAVTRADGSRFRVVKKPEYFTMNVPVPYVVKSQGHFAWAVTFSPDDWTGFPADWKGSEDIKIQAQFKIDPTPESKVQKVWTGKIESTPMKVNLTRFIKQMYLRRSGDPSD